MIQEERNKIREALKQVSDSMTRISAEKDLIKDIVAGVVEECSIPKKVFNKMAKVYYKQNFSEEIANNEEFENIYTEVVNSFEKQGQN